MTAARPARRPSRTFRAQGEVHALMAEAAGDAALDPGAADRRNVVLLLQAAFFITGSMNLPRGWVRAAGSWTRWRPAAAAPRTLASCAGIGAGWSTTLGASRAWTALRPSSCRTSWTGRTPNRRPYAVAAAIRVGIADAKSYLETIR